MALLGVVAAWLCLGVYGAVSYGHAYLTYRGFPPPKDPPGVARGVLYHEHFHSRALGQRRSYLVYTPPGYGAAAARGKRFPVLYLLHGSPGTPMQFINVSHAGVDLDTGMKRHTLKPFILVMPSGSDGTFRSETEWANTAHGRYESLVLEVVHSVDRHFATLRNRRFRAIAGNSEGGYAAVNIALHHLRMFSIAEGWSGYYWRDHAGPFAYATAAQVAYNDPTLYAPLVRRVLHRYPLHAYLYKGSREPISVRLRAEAFAAELRGDGAHVSYRVFKGGHDWLLWRRHTSLMLRFANRWFGVRV